MSFKRKIMMSAVACLVFLFFQCADDGLTFLRYDPDELLLKDTVTGGNLIGCPDTEYDDWRNSPYVLPYPVGSSCTIDLSHCSGAYHSAGQPDQFAIDFRMDVGTIITASRAGRVVFIEESGIDGAFPNNKVVIKHSDGTYGQYMHLTFAGALVETGDDVQPGDEIALSGATGLAGYPHLHFVVTRPGSFDYPYESLPTTFRNTEANERSLVSGHTYLAKRY